MSAFCLARNRMFKLGLILMMGMSMSSCSCDQHWKEEVQLSDGKVIVIERDLITESGGDEWAINRSGSKPKEYRIRFEYPIGSGKKIEWISTKIDPQTYPEVPLVFEIEAGQPVVFTIVPLSIAQEVYSEYVYKNESWIEEKLPEQFERRATNLLFGSEKDLPSLLKLEEKRKRNTGPGYSRSLRQVGPNRQVAITD